MKFLVSLVTLFALISGVCATFSQGSYNLTRDYRITYSTSKYNSTETFCRALRSSCVKYAGSIGHHHQLDCKFNQKGPMIRAFCGSVKKNSDGSWDSAGKVYDNTKTVVSKYLKAKISGKPLSLKNCKAYKAHHKSLDVVCGA